MLEQRARRCNTRESTDLTKIPARGRLERESQALPAGLGGEATAPFAAVLARASQAGIIDRIVMV